MYLWWVLVHLAGVLLFVAAHGVSMTVTFRLRRVKDPAAIGELLQLSGSSIRVFYAGFALILVGGTVSGFLGSWWSQAWIWASLAVLILTSVLMYALARPYYRRVGLIARALAGGSKAVSQSQFEEVLRSGRPMTIAAIGLVALASIVAMMVFKPSFGLGGTTAPPVAACEATGTDLRITARSPLTFDTDCLAVPADTAFTITFDNQERSVPHNVSIYTDSTASQPFFVGDLITGVDAIVYEVSPIPVGTYVFRCDVHPQMNGAFIAQGTSPGPSPS